MDFKSYSEQIYEDILPRYISLGVSKQEFMDSSPKELAPYIKAHSLRMEEMDRVIWSSCGNYVLSAVFVAVERCLNGKKASSKYVEKPVFSIQKEEEFTEEELQKQRELFVAKLMVMKSNFELNKGK